MARIVEKRRRGIVGWIALTLFWGWNAVMGFAMYTAGRIGTESAQNLTSLTASERMGHDAGVGIALVMLLAIWAMGAVVLGLIAHFTRGRREFITT